MLHMARRPFRRAPIAMHGRNGKQQARPPMKPSRDARRHQQCLRDLLGAAHARAGRPGKRRVPSPRSSRFPASSGTPPTSPTILDRSGLRDGPIALARPADPRRPGRAAAAACSRIIARMRQEVGAEGRPEFWYFGGTRWHWRCTATRTPQLALARALASRPATGTASGGTLFEDEPAFAELRQDPRFQALAAQGRGARCRAAPGARPHAQGRTGA